MKKFSKFIVALLALFIMVIPFSASAQEVNVSVVSFPVIINGNLVNNDMREYPFILYKDITYFPMTYEDCAFLGVENNWSAESGNVLTKTVSSGIYCDHLSPELSLKEHSKVATIVSTPVTVLGEVINNGAQEFPILNYNNVLYFPLTWDWSQKFGWRTTFTTTSTFGNLEVATEDFADAGYLFVYSIDKNKEPKKFEIARTDFLYLMNSCYNAEFGFSPNYTGNTDNYANTPVNPPEGYRFLYRLVAANGTTTNHITVNDKLYSYFIQNGWYEVGQEEKAMAEFAKTHTKNELRGATNALPYVKTEQGNLESTLYSMIADYQTLVSSDARVCSAKSADIATYKSVGWMTEQEYVDYYTNLYIKSGDLSGALTFLEDTMYMEHMRTVQVKTYRVWDYDYEKTERVYNDLTKKVLAKMKKNVELRAIYPYESGTGAAIIFNCSVPASKTINGIEISFDVVDAQGKVVDRVTTTGNIYAQNYGNEKVFMAETVNYTWNSSAAVNIRNVQVKKINTVNTDFLPGGQG